MEDNNAIYDMNLADRSYTTAAYSTWEFVRTVKGWPEWSGLSASQADHAIALGYAKVVRDGGNPWDLLPGNNFKGLDAQEDFLAAWPKVKIGRQDGRDYLTQAVELAKANPINWDKDLQQRLAPVTPRFKLFCDTCMCLQSMVGAQGYILLWQERLAELLGTKQEGISVYCQRAKLAGLLVELDNGHYERGKKCKHWRCTCTWTKGLPQPEEDYCY